ncbi:hypothetical protein D3C74_451440 [compost metagenome]
MKSTKIKNWICNLFSKMRTTLVDQLGEIDTSVYEQAVKNAVSCSKTVKIGKVNYTVNLHFLPDGKSIEDCVENIIVSKAQAQTT